MRPGCSWPGPGASFGHAIARPPGVRPGRPRRPPHPRRPALEPRLGHHRAAQPRLPRRDQLPRPAPPRPHPPLVDPATFQAAQQLLDERGEDRRASASNASPYLLAGKILCTHCGLHYVGTAATGNRYRYRYYTCFSHQRYGKQACPSERLPADQLDQAILAGLLDTFARTDLAEQATRAIRSQATHARDRAEGELAAVRTEIDQAEAAIERYLGAFEAGTLPEAQCGKRLEALGAKIAELQARELELQQALAASATQELPTPADLAEVASQVRQVIEHAPVAAKKTLAQQLVHEIHVTSRDDIRPIFRVPTRNEPSPGDGEKVR